MKISKPLFLLLLVIMFPDWGLSRAPAEAPAIASDLQARIDSLFVSWDKKDSPGCVLGVIRDGKIIYQRAYGMADLERGVVNTPASVMDVGSISKQFTAACILMLERQGKLKLDDPIRQYLPEIPDYGAPLTVRHLIHHTSGIRDYLTLMDLAGLPGTNDYPVEQIVELISRQKELNFAPGSEYLYSNSGYFLLAEIVKRVSGQNLRRFAEENIFKPLGMSHTHIHDDFTEIVPNRSLGYLPLEKDGWQNGISIFDVVGDGAVMTTVGDLFLWDQNFYHNVLAGGDPEFVEQLQTPGALNGGEKLDYAFGLHVGMYRGLKKVSHSGGWAGYMAMLQRFPEQKFSVILLANRDDIDAQFMADEVTDLCLEKEFGTVEAETGKKQKSPSPHQPRIRALPAAALSRLTGAFRNPETSALIKIELKEGNLQVATSSGFIFKMAPIERLKFVGVETPIPIAVTFIKAKGGEITGIQTQFADRRPQKFETIQLFSPSQTELAAYEGDYYSPELDVSQRVRVRDGQLTVSLRYDPEPLKLQPTFRDEFVAPGISVVFKRNEKGDVIGHAIKAGRVKNIVFGKI
jgi:CubicO group peptidase (beta-lactamase class C family)